MAVLDYSSGAGSFRKSASDCSLERYRGVMVSIVCHRGQGTLVRSRKGLSRVFRVHPGQVRYRSGYGDAWGAGEIAPCRKWQPDTCSAYSNGCRTGKACYSPAAKRTFQDKFCHFAQLFATIFEQTVTCNGFSEWQKAGSGQFSPESTWLNRSAGGSPEIREPSWKRITGVPVMPYRVASSEISLSE